MLEELRNLFQAVLGFLAEIPPLASELVSELSDAADRLLEPLGALIGHENGLFLPAGKGASILILGGIAMVVISLSIALYRPAAKHRPPGSSWEAARSGTGPNGAGGSWARFSSAHAAPVPDPAWLTGLRKALAKSEVGELVLLSEPSGRRAVALPACSGSEARQGGPTCDRAHELILSGLRAVEPEGRVVAVSCKAEGGQACVFEIRIGGTAP